MTARTLVRPRVVASGTLSINTATTSNVDFGTPDDVKLAVNAGVLNHDDRLVAVFTARTAGTTDPISFSVQDAPDNAGAIGTPATAVTDGAMTGGTGSQVAVVAVKIQSGRPWLRFRATRTGTTDTHLVSVVLLALSPSI
jgi:hypothetical protein